MYQQEHRLSVRPRFPRESSIRAACPVFDLILLVRLVSDSLAHVVLLPSLDFFTRILQQVMEHPFVFTACCEEWELHCT